MFILSRAGETAKKTCFRTFLALVALSIQVVMTAGVSVYSASHGYTFFGQLLQGYRDNHVVSLVAAFNLVACLVSLVALHQFVSPDGTEVQVKDAAEHPDEALLWKWCVPCGVLRPPGTVHCILCQRCVKNRYFHRWFEWKCIATPNIRPFLCWVVGDMLSSLCVVRKGNFLAIYSFVFNMLAVLRGVYHHFIASPPKLNITVRSYPKEAFVFCRSLPGTCTERQPEFSHSFEKGNTRLHLCPAADKKTDHGTLKRRAAIRCPGPGCNSVANRFWVTCDEGDVVECNMCEAVFTFPPGGVNVYPSLAEMTQPDGAWLVEEGDHKAKMVFIVDSLLAVYRCAEIDRWVREDKPPLDIEVVSPAESRVWLYRTDIPTGEINVQEIFGQLDLDTVVAEVSQKLFCRGGKMVFIRDSGCPMASTTLAALACAARRAPLDYVSLARVAEASSVPDLNPALLKQIQDGGGTFRWLPASHCLREFLRRRDLVPWGL